MNSFFSLDIYIHPFFFFFFSGEALNVLDILVLSELRVSDNTVLWVSHVSSDYIFNDQVHSYLQLHLGGSSRSLIVYQIS